jgi:uncharacterized protein (TIGR03435 family)
LRQTMFLILLTTSVLAQTERPLAFETASVKMKPANQALGQASVTASPGTLTMRNVTMTTIIKWAYRLQAPQITGPSWLESAHYDVVAKAGAPANDAELRRMVQTLLADRFKLTAHRENRQMNVFVLVEAKGGHKMKESGESGPAQTTIDPTRSIVNKSTSMVELTERLAEDAGSPVIDLTGLKGLYDFVLDIRPYLPPKQEGIKLPLDAFGIMQTALQGELGLKVEPPKASTEVLVIDHLDKQPMEN